MQFQHILHAKTLLANQQQGFLSNPASEKGFSSQRLVNIKPPHLCIALIHSSSAEPRLACTYNESAFGLDNKTINISILRSLSYLSLKIKLALYEMMKKIGYLSLAALLTNSVEAIEVGDIKNISSLQCPSGLRHVTQDEAKRITSHICHTFDYWAIMKLEGNYKLSGEGYGCRVEPIKETDNASNIGHSLCAPSMVGEPIIFDSSRNYQAEKSNVYFFTPYPNPLERKANDLIYSDAATNARSVWSTTQTYSKVTVAAQDEHDLTHFMNLRANLGKNNKYYRLNEGYGSSPLYVPSSFRFAFHDEDNQRLASGFYRIGDISVSAARWHDPNAESTVDNTAQTIGDVYVSFSNSRTAQIPLTFDYDPSLLPDVTEAIFVLRIKNANIGERFVVNMSGNYLLEFTKDRIYVFDTYTKNSDVYKYQSANPNITIGLGVSKGLPHNYKNITIKEDSNGQLYDYAALHSDNITSDDAILNETISHPFYEIAGKDGIEDKVTISKAMAFYHELHAHERHARCVRPNMTILEELKEIFSSGSVVCQPKPVSNIYSANHNSAEDMRLEQQLIEAVVDERKYHDTVGYHLRESFDLKDKNTIAFVTSSRYCKVPIMSRVAKHRHKRSLGSGNCVDWTSELISLYVLLGLNFLNLNDIVQNVLAGNGIAAAFFPDGQYPPNSEADIAALQQVISSHGDQAANVLQEAAGLTGQAAMADPLFLSNDQGASFTSQVDVQNSVAEARLGSYTLVREEFKPLTNVVRRVNRNLETEVLEGEQYTTNIIHVTDHNINSPEIQTTISQYLSAITNWIDQINSMKIGEGVSQEDITQLELGLRLAKNIQESLKDEINPGIVINTVYHNGILVGINIGLVDGREYSSMYGLVIPSSLLRREGAYRGAVAYLRSEALRKLFSNGIIDFATAEVISRYSASSVARLGFKHDEL